MAPAQAEKRKPKGGTKKTSAVITTLKARMLDLQEKNKVLDGNNKQLVAQVNQLQLDKGELQSKLEAEQKRNGGSVEAETEQCKLSDVMKASVRNLVQQNFFLRWPFLDKQMFSQGNLIAPATKFLNMTQAQSQRYAVDIRRVCIAKTTYWRGYCGDQVKKEYISK